MTTLESIILIAVVVAATMLTRFIPFLVFSARRTPPPAVAYLGKVLPYAVIGLLIVYCLKDAFAGDSYVIPEGLAILGTVFLHLWKGNALLSIGGGTAAYMLLVQTCFA